MKRVYYRVECNFGSKYFNHRKNALIYSDYCKARNFEAEVWQVCVTTADDIYSVVQVLLTDYIPRPIP